MWISSFKLCYPHKKEKDNPVDNFKIKKEVIHIIILKNTKKTYQHIIKI